MLTASGNGGVRVTISAESRRRERECALWSWTRLYSVAGRWPKEKAFGAPSRAIRGTPHYRKSVMALAAFGRHRLLHRLHRPQQHLGRSTEHEQGSGLHRLHLRLGRRHLLLRLFPVRDSEQPDPRARRRAALDRAHYDHVGHHLRSHCIRHRPHQLPGHSFPARRRRGRVLPRHDPVFHLLVPAGISRPGDLDLVHRAAGGQCAGLDHFGCDSRHERGARV